jgi:carbon starvation protein
LVGFAIKKEFKNLKESIFMNALTLIFVSLCIFAIGYRFYGIFLSRKLLHTDSGRITPAHKYYDGRDYMPTNKNVLFGHHFAAIAAAGPLAGPVLAAQFGFLPGALLDTYRLCTWRRCS